MSVYTDSTYTSRISLQIHSAPLRESAAQMNTLGHEGVPFLFLIDFESLKPIVLPLTEAADAGIFYDFAGFTNLTLVGGSRHQRPTLTCLPTTEIHQRYLSAFGEVRAHLMRGDIYLTNLTASVPIECTLSLQEIFLQTDALCKVLVRDHCVVFSPEMFVTIDDGAISTFPMKGTRLELTPEDEHLLLSDVKEASEHATVVDLLRNDLSVVASDVLVRRYRFVERIVTQQGVLLQTSSEITGRLEKGYQGHLGDIICALLPAGSVSGAPKQRAVEIAGRVEADVRGYYTGVFGIWDGECLKSAVMIRFIEARGPQLFFRSGGGITVSSDLENEYAELLSKVALPGRRCAL